MNKNYNETRNLFLSFYFWYFFDLVLYQQASKKKKKIFFFIVTFVCYSNKKFNPHDIKKTSLILKYTPLGCFLYKRYYVF